ncbi:transcriptional regulator [Serratia fonticola]|uniref:transcriptional regulator n=1 Tax=Serratia fonticola TaxID=47917 RepID=UPI0034C684F3
MTTKQRNLLLCLIGEVNYKNDIMIYLWGNDNPANENKYNQLVFKLRETLQVAGFPNDVIITMYRYGLCLNNNLLRSDAEAERQKMTFLFNAPARNHDYISIV